MKTELLYPELSYRILGCAFNVHNELGGSFPENVYQRALAIEFELKGIPFIEQNFSEITYKNKKIQRNFSDFLVEDLVIVELKSTYRITSQDFKQTKKDLVAANKKLGILLHFGRQFLTHKRVLNLY